MNKEKTVSKLHKVTLGKITQRDQLGTCLKRSKHVIFCGLRGLHKEIWRSMTVNLFSGRLHYQQALHYLPKRPPTTLAMYKMAFVARRVHYCQW